MGDDRGVPALFKWYEAGLIAASGRPQEPEQLGYVADQGITRIVATSTKEPDQATIAELGMSCIHIPNVTKDLDALDRAVDALREAVVAREKVLVH